MQDTEALLLINEVSKMQTTDWINLSLSILSFILAAVSVITVIITLRQNNRMLEESTRPVLSFYTDEINTGSPSFYFIVRNNGSSPAIIRDISSDQDFTKFLIGVGTLEHMEQFDPIRRLKNAVIAPGQSRRCALDYYLIPDRVTIHVKYSSSAGKMYAERYNIDLKAGVGMLSTKSNSSDELKTLREISYALQEKLQKEL